MRVRPAFLMLQELVHRSSHAGCVVAGNKIMIFGGAGKGKDRLSDTHVLHVGSRQLTWQPILGPPFPVGKPPPPLHLGQAVLAAPMSSYCSCKLQYLSKH